MKALFGLIIAVQVTVCVADPVAPPKDRPQVSQKMQLQFAERTRTASAETGQSGEVGGDVVELDPIEVRADEEEYFVFAHERRTTAAKPFTWKEGGVWFLDEGDKATTKLMFQYDPENNCIQFINISF